MNKLYKRIAAAAFSVLFTASAFTSQAAIPLSVQREYEQLINCPGSEGTGEDDFRCEHHRCGVDNHPTSEQVPAIYAHLWYRYSTLSEEIPEECYSFIRSAFYSPTYKSCPIDEADRYFEIKDYYLSGDSVIVSYRDARYYYSVHGDYVYAAITNKSGKLLYVGRPNETLSSSGTYYARHYKETVRESLSGEAISYAEASRQYEDPPLYQGRPTECYDVELRFKLPDFFDPEKHTIVFSPVRIKGWSTIEDGSSITFDAHFKTDSSKLVEKTQYDIGDANADGEVNLTDASLMMKYVAEWDVEIDTALADLTENGTVTLADVSQLLKIIAGWNV